MKTHRKINLGLQIPLTYKPRGLQGKELCRVKLGRGKS
jgi:hypothetical protein